MTEVFEVVAEENQAQESTVAIPKTVEKFLHPLKNKWTYWYLDDYRKANWEKRLKPIRTFSTVEEFWALYENIRPPSGSKNYCGYNVFKAGIKPIWEVEENLKGGRWIIPIEKGKPVETIDLIWLQILLALIGEQFGEDMELICGLVCNIRNKGSKISVWTRDYSAEEGNMRIGMILTQHLLDADIPKNFSIPLFEVLRYQDHDSCQKKGGSTLKANLSITATELPKRN